MTTLATDREVVEDYGSGKINRTTTTNAYTSWGTANDVTDAAGHRFYTDYDGDGRIHSVTRTDVTPNEPVVTYTYNDGTGTNLAQKYQVSQIEDNLSGIVQTFSYCDSGGGRGQVVSVSDDNSAVGASDFAASYTYSDEGDRRCRIEVL